MKMLVLLIITTWSFSVSPFEIGPGKILVSTPKEAAVEVYRNEITKFGPEPDHHEYQLWEIDFENKTMKQINIPSISFGD